MRSQAVFLGLAGSISNKDDITGPRKMFYEERRTELVGCHWSKQDDSMEASSRRWSVHQTKASSGCVWKVLSPRKDGCGVIYRYHSSRILGVKEELYRALLQIQGVGRGNLECTVLLCNKHGSSLH